MNQSLWELDILLGKREILSGREGDSIVVKHKESSSEGKEVFLGGIIQGESIRVL